MTADTQTRKEPAVEPQGIDAFLNKASCLWDVVQDLGNVLKYTRLSLLVTLLAGLLLIFVDQGQELIIVKSESSLLERLAFYLAIIFWALNAWYWARVTLTYGAEIPYKDDKDICIRPYFGGRLNRVTKLVKHVPRLLGTLAFLLIACAQVKAAFREGLSGATAYSLSFGAVISLALAALFYVAALKRRPITTWLRQKIDPQNSSRWAETWLNIPKQPPHQPKLRVGELPHTVKRIFLLLVVALVGIFLVALIDPVTLGKPGPHIVYFIGASLWIAPGTWLLFVARRGDVPVLTIIVVWGLAWSFINDNHQVRRLDGDQPKRMTLDDAIDAWVAAAEDTDRLVFVATAGGGSRAAYWTAVILGTIRDIHSDFDRQLFGISGVSGGALGATVYRGLVTAKPKESKAACAVGSKFATRACGQQALDDDFLGPALAGTIFPDMVQRVLPWGVLPDRAEALERAWERSWADALGKKHGMAGLMAGDFFQAWPAADSGEPPGPALFLNGTSVATGKRIVTSNLVVEDALREAFDFFQTWPGKVPLSTAANNAARFPIIEPAGTLHRKAAKDDANPNKLDRIVDGGYFENFGAVTALDILRRIAARPGELWKRLVVVQISSDPDYPGVKRTVDDRKMAKASPASFAGELRSPLQGLLKTRTARGALAAQHLHDWTADKDLPFIELRLVKAEGESEPPLGWILSKDAMDNIDCQLAQAPNRKNLDKLASVLKIKETDIERALGHC